MSKKQLTQQLAKADCKRCNEGQVSIASEIMNDPNFSNMADIIKKKSRTNEECAYLKTADAWFKRFSTLTVAQLTNAVDTFVNAEITNDEKLENLVDVPLNSGESNAEGKLLNDTDAKSDMTLNDHKSQVSLASIKEESNDASKKRAYSHISLNIRDPLDSSSTVSKTMDSRSTVSKAMDSRSTVSKAMDSRSTVSRAMDSRSTVSKATDSRSTVSRAMDSRSTVSRAMDSRSEISVSDKKSVVSLAESSLNKVETESDINSWYEEELKLLQSQTLRDEQYRRKRALLRVEYWTKLDKIRNNATPTVINF